MTLAHALFKSALFLVAGVVDHATGTRDLRAVSGVGRRLPWLAGVAALAAIIWGGAVWYRSSTRVTTDDAYVEGVISPVSAKVSGHIVEMNVRDNQAVKRGDLLLRVDPRDFEALLAGFVPLTLTVNDLNRSMGMHDPYPFVLSPPAIAKLRFVHDLVAASAAT
jgi:hypothetical protein